MTRVLILLSFAICLKTYGQAPSYEAVLTYMHENIEVNPEQGSFEIQKKPEGYFICTSFIVDGQSGKLEDCQKIWSSATNDFIKPTYDNELKYAKNEHYSMASRFSSLWSGRRQVVPLIYYGYSGWISDAKIFLEKKHSLTPKELETLARAYSSEANEYIHPGQYVLSRQREMKYENAGYSKISAERLSGYKQANDKSLQLWERIKEKDPNYIPNLITDIDLKIGNEYMHAYLTMYCIHEPELANEYLKKVSYPNSFVVYAKSLLGECEENGILFTSGDNDTYPLWYVQEKLGFRKDVTVINLSLAQASWYLEFLMDRHQLKSSFSAQEVRDNERKYFVFRKDEKISFTDWVDSFHETQKNPTSEIADHENYVSVDGTWELKRGSDLISINRDEQYAYAYQVFLYDVIASNPKRGLFSVSYFSFKDLGLKRYCVKNGHLFRMETTMQTSYMADDSELKIINAINDIPTGFFAGLGNWESIQRSLNLGRANMVSSESADQIISIVEKNILSDLAIEKTDPNLANSIDDFYGKFNKTKQKDFKREYDAEAVKFVKGFVDTPNTLYDNLDEFYDLISIYTSMSRYEMMSHKEEDVNWGGSMTLYNVLKTRLDEISETCENDNLEASSNRVSELLGYLNACDMD